MATSVFKSGGKAKYYEKYNLYTTTRQYDAMPEQSFTATRKCRVFISMSTKEANSPSSTYYIKVNGQTITPIYNYYAIYAFQAMSTYLTLEAGDVLTYKPAAANAGGVQQFAGILAVEI